MVVTYLQLLTHANLKQAWTEFGFTSTHVENVWHNAIDNDGSLKMATSPTESPPPPLFRPYKLASSGHSLRLQSGMADQGVFIPNMAARTICLCP